MSKIHLSELETAKVGYANGISLQLHEYLINNPNAKELPKEIKQHIIETASFHYGEFLTALGVDWKNDPNSSDTPRRVAKAYVNDLWRGRYELLGNITTFPSDGYTGIVLEKDIPIVSMCSHHHLTILGKCHVAYIPSKESDVVGLSKLNRIVEHYSRRGAIQEQLTIAIHTAIDRLIQSNAGVLVVISATHNCVSCRGVKHIGASMITSEVSGAFADHTKTAKAEVFEMIKVGL